MIRAEYFQCKPITLDKVSFLAERYITYWLVVLLLITAAPFINKTDLFDIINGYDFIQNNSNWDYFYHIGISFALAFANLIPTRSVRPDLSSFVSSFTGEDYSIRDSAHTRLKDLSEILCDIKLHGFALLSTDIYTPIIVSTVPPEELRIMPGFTALLSTDTFANNQILRFIQVEKDVDTFFVLRNDIGMCHHIEYDPAELQDVTMSLLSGSVGHIDISDQDLSLYGSASFVFLVGLFVTEASINIVAALSSWVAWPLLAVLLFRRRHSKLASINFFTLDGKDRKYQPFNNICVCSDDLILSKIRSFTFFCALTKFTPQKNYLVHTLLKVVEGLQYCWLERGLTVRDFKRLAELAAVTYEQDVAVITPNARVYYSAPRRLSEHCVVCVVNTKGEVNSECMTHAQFLQVSDSLPYGQDTQRVELMLLK